MEDVFIGLGSNLGNRRENLRYALTELKKQGIQIAKVSAVYETEPWGVKEQPPFLNLVLQCKTVLKPLELLRRLKEIERTVGRKETFRWGPRVIDLDILYYGKSIINEPELVVPHPHLKQRAFVLKPLSDIAPDFKDPVTGLSVAEMLDSVSTDGVIKTEEGL